MVKRFADHPITLKTSVKYKKEYDRNTEKEILNTVEESSSAKDFSWESKIEEADEIEKAQGNMPQVGMGVTYYLYQTMNFREIGFVTRKNTLREFSSLFA